MTHPIFDAQAALLYDDLPAVDFKVLTMWINELAVENKLPGTFEVLKGATNDVLLSLAGAGVHITVSLQDTPLAVEAFDVPLKAPILAFKKFDFTSKIKSHRAGIVINVGDGEVPMAADVRQMMSQHGVGQGVDPEVKLTALHIALQGVATICTPLMVDFCPSQQLLTPQELAVVNMMGLPIPILIHPFPLENAPAEDGTRRFGMEAIHAGKLIGSRLELEAIPVDMPIATRINMLATLIMEKRAGAMPLNHGDTIKSDDGFTQYIRHELDDAGATRIIVSYDTRAEGGSRPGFAATTGPGGGQQTFQDRISKLKARSQTSGEAPMASDTPEIASPLAENPEDLRARIRETIGTDTAGRSSGIAMGPIKLVVGMAVCAGLFTFFGGMETTERVVSDTMKASTVLKQIQVKEPVQPSKPVATGITVVQQIEGAISR